MTTRVSKGYYCLIQYCPDLGRLEAANIGVLLFCPEANFLDAKIARHNQRIIKFFGRDGHDWDQINSFKRGLVERIAKEATEIKQLDDLRQFIAVRANILQITDPRPMKVFDPEADLKKLFREFIGDSGRRRSTVGLHKQIRASFQKAGVESKIVTDIKVDIPLFQKEVQIPFGFVNGAFHLLNPVAFEAKSVDASLTQACRYAVAGESINQTKHPTYGDQQFCVIGGFRPKDRETRERVKSVFDHYGVKLYRADRLDGLIEEIKAEGKELRPREHGV